MNSQSTFSGLTQQFALACGLCSLFQLMTLGQGEPVRYFPFVLLPYALAVYAANHLFLRQRRTMREFVLLNAAFFTAVFASVLFIEGIVDLTALIFQAGFCLWITVWGAHRCLQPPDLRSLITSLDLSVLLLLIYTALLTGAGLPIFWCAPTAAGCAASILGLIAQRAGRPLGLKERGILLLVFSGLSTVMWLLVIVAAAPAGQGLVAMWNALAAAVRWLARKLWTLFLFVLFLFPSGESEETIPPDPTPALSAEEMTAAGINPAVFVALAAVLTAAVIAAMILILHRLGKLTFGGARTPIAAQRRSGRISLRQALRRMWAALMTRLRLRLFLRRNRNTPEGLFYLLSRRCRLGPWRKRTGETPREFLTRLREAAKGDSDLFSALNGLIPAVDAALYAPSYNRQFYPGAKLIRRRFGAVSRRLLFRRGLERLWTGLARRRGRTPS